MSSALSSLRDMDGVIGSFLVGKEGDLLACDMPAMFERSVLSQAGERVARLRNALELDGASFETALARFGAHTLMLRRAAERTLCVLVPQGVNLSALQMGANLVARRVADEKPEERAPELQVSPPSSKTSSEPTQPLRRFRGGALK